MEKGGAESEQWRAQIEGCRLGMLGRGWEKKAVSKRTISPEDDLT